MTLVKNGLRSSLGALVALAACGLVATGCDRKDESHEDVDTAAGEVEGAFGAAKEDIEDAARKGYDKLEHGTDRALEGIDRAGERAQEAVEETGEDVARGTSEAVDDTRHAADKVGDDLEGAADATGEKLHEAGEDTKALGERTADDLDEGVDDVQRDAERTDEKMHETAEGVEGATEGTVGAVAGGAVALAASDAAERLASCDLDEPFEVFFAEGSNRPDDENLSRARKVGECMKKEGEASKKVVVMAYSDPGSGATSGLDLSINRAKNIAQTLLDSGISPDQLLIQATPSGDKQTDRGSEYARHATIVVR